MDKTRHLQSLAATVAAYIDKYDSIDLDVDQADTVLKARQVILNSLETSKEAITTKKADKAILKLDKCFDEVITIFRDIGTPEILETEAKRAEDAISSSTKASPDDIKSAKTKSKGKKNKPKHKKNKFKSEPVPASDEGITREITEKALKVANELKDGLIGFRPEHDTGDIDTLIATKTRETMELTMTLVKSMASKVDALNREHSKISDAFVEIIKANTKLQLENQDIISRLAKLEKK